MNTILDVARFRSAVRSLGLSQSRLARESGVSRAHLGRLLAQKRVHVRVRTLEGLARALHVDPAELTVGGELQSYLESVAHDHAELDFRGIGMPQLRKQPIQDIFVEFDVQEEPDKCLREDKADDECFRGAPRGSARKRALGETMPATECVRGHDRVVILGNPGAGKTTLLRQLAHLQATRQDADAEVPIYVPLPELCRAQELDDRVDPVKLVAARAVQRGCADVEQPLVDALSNKGRRCLVLLDGLDEVGSEEERRLLVERIRDFIDRYPRNRFVITSRIIGFDSAPWRGQGFAVFRILPYGAKQLETCADRWAGILAPIKKRPRGEVFDSLKTAIFSNPRVRALASNPLILTILVLLNEARGGTLPRRRVDLYEKVVDVFLDTWESSKRETGRFDDTYNIDLDAREFRWLLSDLSLAMQKAKRTLAPRWWITGRMEDYLRQKVGFSPDMAKDASDRIVRYLTERTGVIEERGLDLFGFSHRTLQEYFASLGVIDEADASRSRDVTRCLRDYFFHPSWSEVVRLVAAQLTPPPAESLVSSILDDPDPVGRFLRRGQLVALRCLSDGTTVANRRLIASIFDSLSALGKSRWLGITLEAIDVLESLEGTRLEEEAQETVETILDTAKDALLPDEYDCLERWAAGREVLKLAEEQIPESFIDSEAAREVTVTLHGRQHHVFRLNPKLLVDHPTAWYSSVCSLLEDPGQSNEFKELLVHQLGRMAARDRRARVRLWKLLRPDAAAPVRAAAVSALAACATGKDRANRLLLQLLEGDPEEQVADSCASALRRAAADDASIRSRLMEILDTDPRPSVRAAAARALAPAHSEPSVREALYQLASSEEEPEKLRAPCAWALAGQIGKDQAITEAFRRWLEAADFPKLRRISAEALAVATADERLAWDHSVVEKAQDVLMNLEQPCPCALDALQALATAREIRRGLRLETVLRDALDPVRDGIELAFVFGSIARNRQSEDSDIDLLIIGGVGLKGLSSPLAEAERTLGRRINPAIYTRKSFQEKYQAGDPFLLDVYRREKIPVIHPEGNSVHGGLDDELRAMVAERMASTD